MFIAALWVFSHLPGLGYHLLYGVMCVFVLATAQIFEMEAPYVHNSNERAKQMSEYSIPVPANACATGCLLCDVEFS